MDVCSKKKVALKDVKVIFRVGFERSSIKGGNSRIGNADSKHLVQIMILNYESKHHHILAPSHPLPPPS